MVSWEDSKSPKPGDLDGIGADKFVEFFRQASPYIVNHHGSVMVVVIPGEVFVAKDILQGIVQDVALLQSLGVRVVLVLGSNKQVEEGLVDRGIGSEVVDGYRVTTPEALEVAMEAAGRNSVLTQALLSRGINVAVTRRHGDRGDDASYDASGMGGGGGGPAGGSFFGRGVAFRGGAGSATGVSGNFIQAKRRGVVKGIDFEYTGDVVSVDVDAVRARLEMGDVVLLSSLGFNAAGEVLNCQAYDVAVSVAVDLRADKLVSYLSPADMPRDGTTGTRMKYMPLSVAEEYIIDIARRSGLSGRERGAERGGESPPEGESRKDGESPGVVKHRAGAKTARGARRRWRRWAEPRRRFRCRRPRGSRTRTAGCSTRGGGCGPTASSAPVRRRFRADSASVRPRGSGSRSGVCSGGWRDARRRCAPRCSAARLGFVARTSSTTPSRARSSWSCTRTTAWARW